jgi:hypothetical protein
MLVTMEVLVLVLVLVQRPKVLKRRGGEDQEEESCRQA